MVPTQAQNLQPAGRPACREYMQQLTGADGVQQKTLGVSRTVLVVVVVGEDWRSQKGQGHRKNMVLYTYAMFL